MMIRKQQQLDHSSRVFYRLSSLVLNLLRLLGISMALMLCGSVTFFIGFFFMPWVLGLAMVFFLAGVVSSLVVSRLSYLWKLILCYASPRKIAAIDVLSDDELGLILKRVDRRCVFQVCKRWRRWEALNRSSIFVRTPDILNQLLPRFPNLLKFRTDQGMSNADLDFLSQTCPKLEVIEFNEPAESTNYNDLVAIGEKGLCALADKCPELTKIVFRERMNISEVGILPFITNSALHLTHLDFGYCDWVTDRSLKAIGSSSCSKTIKKLVLKSCHNISDSGVSCLKNLCLLEELDLESCSQITDSSIEFLANGSITRIMKKLDISYCDQITNVGVSHMQKMCVLEDLNLEHVNITNRALEFLANGSLSKTLKKLNLTLCDRIDDSGVSFLKNMCVLEELNMPRRRPRITDRALQFLANGSWSKTMKKLNLSRTNITDVVVSHLSDMCVLNELNLGSCPITDRALEYLANGSVPRTMKKLDINDCKQITDVGVSHIQKMCVLEELNLDGCGTITDRALEFLANGFPLKTLKKLDISHCWQITDAGFSNIQKMCVLEELNLELCVEITNRALEFLANGFPSKTLKKLNLRGTKITDVGASHLRDTCVLKELSLERCSITDVGLKFLANGFPSKTLKKLDLYNTNITDAGLQFLLQNMSVLEELDLQNCSLITDYGLEYLANGSPSKTLKFLNFLEIWGTYITNIGVSHLQKMLVME